jgi:hypothetical protein
MIAAAGVALLVLTTAARAANADAGPSIVAGLDDLDDLAPPGSTAGLTTLLEETNEALCIRWCELTSRGLDDDELLSPPAGAVPQGGPNGGDTRHQLGAWTDPALATVLEPMLVLETARKLVPPELMARLSGPPQWTGQSHEERTAHLARHVANRVDSTSKRRTQWQWEGSSTLAQGDSLAAAVAAYGDGSGQHGCTDPLASNTGATATSCAYDCATLQQELFPGLPSRCFIYDTSTQTWPAELLGWRSSPKPSSSRTAPPSALPSRARPTPRARCSASRAALAGWQAHFVSPGSLPPLAQARSG